MAEGVSNTLRHSPPAHLLPPASIGVISRDSSHWLHQDSLLWSRENLRWTQEGWSLHRRGWSPPWSVGLYKGTGGRGKHWFRLRTVSQLFSRAEAKSRRNHEGWEGLSSCWRETVGDRDGEAAFERWTGRGPTLQSPCPPINISPPETFPSRSTEATGY